MFTDTVSTFAGNLQYALPPILVVLAFVAALWLVLNWITPFNDHEELIDNRNYAYTAQRLSLCAAQVIGMLHVITGYSVKADGWHAIGNMCIEGSWVFVALLLARVAVDYVVLYRIPNMDKLTEGNVSVGLVEGGAYLSFGFILNGSLSGTAPSAWLGFASTVVFGLLGLLVVLLVYLIPQGGAYRNLSISNDRRDCAIDAASLLVALGIVVRTGVAGDFTSWGDAFAGFFATVLFAVVTLYTFKWLINRLILPSYTLRKVHVDQNVPAAILFGGLLILVAIVVQAALQAHL